MPLQITDIAMQDLLRMAKGDTDGHFLVVCHPNGLQFTHVSKEALKKLKNLIAEEETDA